MKSNNNNNNNNNIMIILKRRMKVATIKMKIDNEYMQVTIQ